MKNPEHLAAIREIGLCVSCGIIGPVDPAHVRYQDSDYDTAPTGIGRKPDDWRTTPLCRSCHDKQHSMSERQFWADIDINPFKLASALWAASPDIDAMRSITFRAVFFNDFGKSMS